MKPMPSEYGTVFAKRLRERGVGREFQDAHLPELERREFAR